jgi:hypothetical protein
MKLSQVVFFALVAVATAAKERVSIATPEVGGAGHRGGSMNARRRRAAEHRNLRLELIQQS